MKRKVTDETAYNFLSLAFVSVAVSVAATLQPSATECST
jgi:hypothetical protein